MHINYWQEIKQDHLGRTGIILIVLIAAMGILAPLLTPYHPSDYTGTAFSPPSLQHWLGTNDVGQDIWTRLLYGARTSLAAGCGVGLFSTMLSIFIGGTAAICGGLADRILMRLVDALIIIPPVIVVILAAAYLKPDTVLLVFLLSALLWPGGARVIRAQTLSLKEKVSVSASRTFGASWSYILFRHIVPDLGPVLAAVIIQDIRRAVFMEAGLSFLGVSDPSVVSWGKMMQQALGFIYLDVWKWWLLPAGLSLAVTVTGFTFVGYSLEIALNPRLRREIKHAGS